MINRQLIVKGRVQGVFFRAETKKMADTLGVKGFVKNLNDKSVFVEAEGEEAMVFRLIDYCHHGPEQAEVEHVSVRMGDVVGYDGFDILHED